MDGKKHPEQKLDPAIIPNSYFQGHQCNLPPEKFSTFMQCSKLRRFILDLTTVKSDDVRARVLYKSYAALCVEKYRQYQNYPLSIHPYSKLRIGLEIIFVIAILISNIMLPVHFSESMVVPYQDYIMYIMYSTDILTMINILTNFLTGRIEGTTCQYVVLDLKGICCGYIKSWFIVDVLSTVSFIPLLMDLNEYITPHLILVSMKALRLPILFIYLSNIMKVFQFGMLLKICTEILVLTYSYITWNMFFQLATEYMIEGSYLPKNPRKCSWLTTGKLWNETSIVRFVYSLERSVSMLRKNSSFNMLTQEGCYEIYFAVAWLIAKLMIFHCGLKYIISAYGQESAASKYFTMTRQVGMYMNQRKLPPRIKKKILKFYSIRYQASFFVEGHILNCVSGQLREDIIMHTGRQLVRELEFLKQMPRTLLLQIGLKLSLVIFIAGDIIYKINTVGDCLYFIDKGTVAVYTQSGKEVCHLEDGNFFGEIALVMKHRFRTVSAVAVSNCELFRLNIEDFNSTIACYSTVYDYIKKVATERFESVCVLDENHKSEMRNAR